MKEERQQILSIYRRLLEAWNRRDPDAFASLFGETGSVVGFDGSQMNGQGDIAATLQEIFAEHQTARYVAKVREIRALGAGTMVLRAVVGMITPGKTEVNPAVNAVQSLVVVIEENSWKIALLHTTPAAFHGHPHMVERLTAELTVVARRGELVELGR
ncbi:MAG: SgcJ/EcaC family oxidoreductase [Rubrobacteraceae bacterium]|nr:SgcJ/EcaC family oxidoreductase [Rubrobacteraceae bacterium]